MMPTVLHRVSFVVIGLVLLVATAPTPARSGSPARVQFQGVLVDPDGVAAHSGDRERFDR